MEEQMAREEHERRLKQEQEEAARREKEAQEAVRKKTQMSRNLKNKGLRQVRRATSMYHDGWRGKKPYLTVLCWQANKQIKLTRGRARLKKGGSATGSFGTLGLRRSRFTLAEPVCCLSWACRCMLSALV